MSTEFNLKECVEEVLLILKLKADYLGVRISYHYEDGSEIIEKNEAIN